MKSETDSERARRNAKRRYARPEPVVWDDEDWDRAIAGLKAVLERREKRP